MSARRFAGRRVLVTGASRGIGAAAAQRFAAEGGHVALVARTVERHDRLAGSLNVTAERLRASGGRVAVIAADIADERDRARIVPEAVEGLGGPVVILVNNAAAGFFVPMRELSLKRARITFEVNVHAPLELARAVIPSMIEHGEGWIVNLSSATARPLPNTTMAVYGASKAALNRLTNGLATELTGTGVRVNTVEPRAAVMSEGAAPVIRGRVSDDQIESMEEMVEAIVALADCPAEYTAHRCVSLDLIDELRLTVHALDGTPLSPVSN
jgi:short-subunit dehydrogenase